MPVKFEVEIYLLQILKELKKKIMKFKGGSTFMKLLSHLSVKGLTPFYRRKSFYWGSFPKAPS